jgi:hypothetical protein
MVAAFEGIFVVTIFFGTEARRQRRVVHGSRFNFLREAQIWYNRDPEQPCPSEEYANVIVLSDEFYREVTEHPIPTDRQAVKLHGAAPAVLDIFMWIAYRCHVAKGEEQSRFSESMAWRTRSGALNTHVRAGFGQSCSSG